MIDEDEISIAEVRAKCDYVDIAPGWTHLVAGTHRKLKALDPDYKLIQVKEKLGGLSYSAAPTETIPRVFQLIFKDVISNAEYHSLYIDINTGDAKFARFKEIRS